MFKILGDEFQIAFQVPENALEAAERYAAPLWDYLQQQARAGMKFPLLGYETGAEIFSASGQASLAWRVVKAGYRELMERADRISLPEWRLSFLVNVPEHCSIQARRQVNTDTSHK